MNQICVGNSYCFEVAQLILSIERIPKTAQFVFQSIEDAGKVASQFTSRLRKY